MTFKEFMHKPNQRLDNLAREAEAQRTANEEAIYDERISKAEQCLIDNGIEPDEASTVLQALGYILLDEELYPSVRCPVYDRLCQLCHEGN